MNAYRVEQINPVTGQRAFVSVPAGLLNPSTGTVGIGQALIASDGRYVYNLAYHRTGSTTTYNGWTIRVFDPRANWAVVKTFTTWTSSFYVSGVLSDGTFLYAVEWTGTNSARVAVIRLVDGAIVRTWTTNQLTAQAVSGQYDRAARKSTRLNSSHSSTSPPRFCF